MLRTVIIEDEFKSRVLLTKMLTEYCEGVSVVGEAEDVKGGIELIKQLKPNVVFLDIEIKGGTGFDILNEVNDIPFLLIFVTGYDQYAIKAIKYAAIEYLLKPLNLHQLRAVITKIKSKEKSLQNRFAYFLDIMKGMAPSKLILNDANHHIIVEFDNILFLKAEGTYVKFYLQNGSTKISSHHLGHFEELLPGDLFFRVHKSFIINLEKVEVFESGRAGKVTLVGGHEISIAARRKAEFSKALKLFLVNRKK